MKRAAALPQFTPHPLLRNAHLMTIAANFWRRRFPRLPRAAERLFEVERGTRVRGECHWQAEPREHPTLVLLHGLEGSSDSGYMLGTAEKAWCAGFNVVRLNQRNCGGTERLTPTLYNSGLSGDIRAAICELIERDRLPRIFAAGFSMGGNLVLKMAAEWEDRAPDEIGGFAAIAPALDLAACASALSARRNFLYQRHFVRRLVRRMRRKAGLFPEVYGGGRAGPLEATLRRIRSVREFDEEFTAPCCGFRDAADYYARSSAGPLLAAIHRPALIVAAQDDPFVPISSFAIQALRANPQLSFVATRHGGHCAFISRERGDARFWAEAAIVRFCRQVLGEAP
ncbi:MAG TPA: alpha/beta fold hydrolase [Candidatus Acidoferrales bacterium]|nr:alpha/beta fold hydrolase [Candidatus Acidoferrales bacterium]